jgi:hypothetical protein
MNQSPNDAHVGANFIPKRTGFKAKTQPQKCLAEQPRVIDAKCLMTGRREMSAAEETL